MSPLSKVRTTTNGTGLRPRGDAPGHPVLNLDCNPKNIDFWKRKMNPLFRMLHVVKTRTAPLAILTFYFYFKDQWVKLNQISTIGHEKIPYIRCPDFFLKNILQYFLDKKNEILF